MKSKHWQVDQFSLFFQQKTRWKISSNSKISKLDSPQIPYAWTRLMMNGLAIWSSKGHAKETESLWSLKLLQEELISSTMIKKLRKLVDCMSSWHIFQKASLNSSRHWEGLQDKENGEDLMWLSLICNSKKCNWRLQNQLLCLR